MKKILIIILLCEFKLFAVSAIFELKNKTNFDVGVYIDNSCLINDGEEECGTLLYSILAPNNDELIKLERTIKEIKENKKIIYQNKTNKITCDYTQGKNFTIEFTIVDSYDEYETDIKIPLYSDKRQLIGNKTEKVKAKKPIYKTLSKTLPIQDNSKYEISYDEQNKEVIMNELN